MCGIVGYTGNKNSCEILLSSLARLEYRGYDSAGIAIIGKRGLELYRKKGKVAKLKESIAGKNIHGGTGLGHTRWATHGRPSEENAHPHTDCKKKLVVIHNGIIENYLTLKIENLINMPCEVDIGSEFRYRKTLLNKDDLVVIISQSGETADTLAGLRLAKKNGFLYIGRSFNYPIALEGALKLKEISYIHAEGYPAGEMKHGPIALIDEDMPVVAIATKSAVYEKMFSNIHEAKSRNAAILAIATRGEKNIKSIADEIFYIPETIEEFTPILNIIPLQLLAYYIAAYRGCDIDQPRNLAKSVVVE